MAVSLQNRLMNKWIKALLAETIFSIWWIVSGLSTVSTFFLPSLSGKPRLVSTISTLVGFAWANFRVFQKQEHKILSLTTTLASHEERKSELRIRQDAESRYFLNPVNNLRNADFNGAYFEFHLMIENVGRRNSSITGYELEIRELEGSRYKLEPIEGETRVQARSCLHGLQPTLSLSKNRVILVPAESTTSHGTLLFRVQDGITMERFVDAGLRMHGEQLRFDNLHCRLTLIDTTDSSATQEFELHEA